VKSEIYKASNYFYCSNIALKVFFFRKVYPSVSYKQGEFHRMSLFGQGYITKKTRSFTENTCQDI
jgi:hypothetical protein